MKVDKIIKNKPLLFLDKILMFFGRFVMIEIDYETMKVSRWYIEKFK